MKKLFLTVLFILTLTGVTFATDISEQIAKTRTYIEINKNSWSMANHNIESVTFGNYKYSNNESSEPLQWIVLDKKDGKALLTTKYILLDKEFESVRKLANKSQENLAEGTTWGLSSLRKWLNNDFYNETFSNDEKNLILTTKNKNKSVAFNDEDHEDTDDKIFLLSVEEGTIYSTEDGVDKFNEWQEDSTKYSYTGTVSLRLAPLNYGHRKTCKDGCLKEHVVWTRTMGKRYERYNGIDDICLRAYASVEGHKYGEVMADYKAGVRPAMWVKYDGPASSITIADVSANSTGNAKSISNNVQENTKPASKNGWVGDYYYQNDVVVKNTWVPYGNDMYYCGSSGSILKNQWIDNTYYVDNTGKMLKNTTTPDGYKVGADGKYIAETKSTQNYNVTNNGNSNLASQVSKAKCVTEYSKDTTVEQMDTVTFGSYPQSDVSGNTKEPIEWIVLEKQGDRVLLLSKNVLDFIHNFKGDIWENSIIRKLLNEEFFNNAFSEYEKKRILEIENLNNGNPAYQTSSLNATKDKIFLLSIEDVKKYFGINEFKEIVKIPKRQAYIYTIFNNVKTSRTKYLINKIILEEIETRKGKGIEFGKDDVAEIEKGWKFSLRTKGNHDSKFTYCSEENGNVVIDLEGSYGYHGVRPAIWVTLK